MSLRTRNQLISFRIPSIVLLQDGANVVEMTQQPYESEDLLQQLLADHPSVLAGDQFNSAEPKRWLLMSREAGVPDDDGGADRWALDHLSIIAVHPTLNASHQPASPGYTFQR